MARRAKRRMIDDVVICGCQQDGRQPTQQPVRCLSRGNSQGSNAANGSMREARIRWPSGSTVEASVSGVVVARCLAWGSRKRLLCTGGHWRSLPQICSRCRQSCSQAAQHNPGFGPPVVGWLGVHGQYRLGLSPSEVSWPLSLLAPVLVEGSQSWSMVIAVLCRASATAPERAYAWRVDAVGNMGKGARALSVVDRYSSI